MQQYTPCDPILAPPLHCVGCGRQPETEAEARELDLISEICIDCRLDAEGDN